MGELCPSSTDFIGAMGTWQQKPADVWWWLLTRNEHPQCHFSQRWRSCLSSWMQRDMKGGNARFFIRYFLVTNSHVLCLLLCRPQIFWEGGHGSESGRQSDFAGEKRKIWCLILAQAYEGAESRNGDMDMSTYACPQGPTFPFFENVSCVVLLTTSLLNSA